VTCFESRAADWLQLAEAVNRIVAAATPLPTEEVNLSDSLGRALSSDLDAPLTLPRYDNSAMDGYSVRGEDVRAASTDEPVALEVVASTRAEDSPAMELRTGQAVRIMTGGPIPHGADSIVRVEDTDAEEVPGRVLIYSAADAGRHIRPAGEDMVEGERVLSRGATIGPGQIGVLAAMGRARVPVHRRPVVAVLPNGDELLPLERFSEVVEGAGITETNGVALAAAVQECGGVPLHLGIAKDNRESIEECLQGASDADALVTAGGASMGETDLLKRVMEEMGFETVFWRIKMRPGTPVSFGFLPVGPTGRPLPVFGLPGNPASAFVTFQVLVRPFILALAGHRDVHRLVVQARAGEALTAAADVAHFYRVCLEESDSGLVARLTGLQGSGLVRSLGNADGLALVPVGVETIEAGEAVKVMLLRQGNVTGAGGGI